MINFSDQTNRSAGTTVHDSVRICFFLLNLLNLISIDEAVHTVISVLQANIENAMKKYVQDIKVNTKRTLLLRCYTASL